MLNAFFQTQVPEAGCDEAGRGCLAGPVFAAAVVPVAVLVMVRLPARARDK